MSTLQATPASTARVSGPSGAPPRLGIRIEDAVPVIELPSDMKFEELRDWLREVLPDQLELIGGRASRLDLGEREIKLFDLRRLLHFLRDAHGVEITGLYVRPESVHRFAERELKLKLFARDTAPAVAPEDAPTVVTGPALEPEADAALAGPRAADPDTEEFVEPSVAKLQEAVLPHDLEPEDLGADARVERRDGRRTLTLRRTLRSGNVVRFDGDVLVFGDVNPGGQVVATGNIVVLGALKGVAHAGASGDEDGFILAFQLRPTQLRIARRIAIAPERPDAGAPFLPEMASVIDGQIVIEAYKGRLR